MTTKQAVDHLCKALKSDEGYWISWKANIAMAFYDEYRRSEEFGKIDIHSIANIAADYFLENLCRDTSSQPAEGVKK
jgi:hypothetical protein